MRKRSFLLVAGACVAALGLTAGAALADPTPFPPDRLLAGVGSNTTQAVMDALSNDRNVAGFHGIKDTAGNFVVSSFDAVTNPPSTTIATTHPNNPLCSNLTRPNGSGAGANALDAD